MIRKLLAWLVLLIGIALGLLAAFFAFRFSSVFSFIDWPFFVFAIPFLLLFIIWSIFYKFSVSISPLSRKNRKQGDGNNIDDYNDDSGIPRNL
jgi:ABC-type dipeptide/oligopeptide/nickel transport system permease subunit